MASRKRSISNDEDMSALYKELDEASCPICMDHPHNAVLLICSSHEKGCRSYICDTSYRHSNCLDRFKKLKEENNQDSITPSIEGLEGSIPNLGAINEDKSDCSNLKCPLCRGSVFGWKVIEEARTYLDSKSRSCSRDSCSFSGNYRELRRHARRTHPAVRPADIDPSRQRAWRRLEDQREYNDIVSAIHSAVPGSVVVGDYMIEGGDRDRSFGDRLLNERDRNEGGRWLSTLVLFQMIGSLDRAAGGGEMRGARSRGLPRHRRAHGLSRRRYLWGENLLGLQDEDDDDEDEEDVVEEDEDDEPDLNLLSDLGDSGRPRRRRRLTRARSDEDRE